MVPSAPALPTLAAAMPAMAAPTVVPPSAVVAEAVAATPAKPVRPPIPDRLREFTDAWWKTTKDTPDKDAAVRAARESQKTLFPAWFDRSDRYRGQIPQELRSREDDRRVRVQLAYRNILQNVAMTVPEDHEIRFRPRKVVGAETVGETVTAAFTRLSDTLNVIVKHYADEADFQETAQAHAQDSFQYRLAVMKIVFDRDFKSDALRSHAESRDQQDNVQRLRMLVEDFTIYKRFTKDSAEYQEMEMLKQSLGIESELRLWAGIRAENVPLASFGIDPAVRGIENAYQASWMYHDVYMTCEEIRTKYAYIDNGDGTWSGVHPDDLTDAKKSGNQRSPMALEWPTVGGDGSGGEKGPSPNADSAAERDRFLVREVWCRRLNKVFVLVEGVQYPVAEWVPEKVPAQWYPFVLQRLNRVTGQLYGHSDVELMAEIQHRINRKRSDEEKMRWLSLPRGFYNTQGIDQTEVGKMRDHKPGEYKGINLGAAKSIKEVMEFYQADFDPIKFDTSKDEVDLSMMAGLPAQMLGTTGQARFSSEVSAATQGAAVNAGQRSNQIRRTLERCYRLIAELLLINLTEEEVKAIAGPLAFWPKVHSQIEAEQKKAIITEQAKNEVKEMVMAQVLQGYPMPDEMTLGTAGTNLIAQKCMQAFGYPEPVSREVLFSRIGCEVTVALNTQADRQQRINGIQMLSSSIQMLAQAAQSAGKVLNLKPLLKSCQPIFGADIDIVDMFQDPPPMPGLPGMPGAPAAPGAQPGLPPDAAGKMAPQAEAADRKSGAGASPTPAG